jgi:hypothetical protein
LLEFSTFAKSNKISIFEIIKLCDFVTFYNYYFKLVLTLKLDKIKYGKFETNGEWVEENMFYDTTHKNVKKSSNMFKFLKN